MEDQGGKNNVGLGRCLVLHWQGPLFVSLVLMFVIGVFINNDPAFRVLYTIIAMTVMWATEPIPTAVTAMLPLVAMPLMKVLKSDTSCQGYFEDTSVVFIITLIMACSLQFTKLNTRFAIGIIKTLGPSLRGLHIFLVSITAILSCFTTNSVSIAFIAPVTRSLLEELGEQGICQVYEDDNPDIPKKKKKPTRVAICFYLSIAYGSSMAGSSTLLGSATNIVVKEHYDARFPSAPDEINFENYFLYAFPPMLVYTILMVLIMQVTYLGLFRPSSADAMLVQQVVDKKVATMAANEEKYASLGPMTVAQFTITFTYVLFIIILVSMDPIITDGWAKGFDELITYSSATVIPIWMIFALPAKYVFLKCWDASSVGTTPGLLTWKFTTGAMVWDVIFSVGTAGALAAATRKSGLTEKLAEFLSSFDSLPSAVSLLLLLILTIIFTNITIDVNVMHAITDSILQMAIKCEVHPLFFALAACLASSMSFLMPQASTPNLLVALYGNIRPKHFFLAGLIPTLAALLTIYIFALCWGGVVYSDLMEFPKWVNEIATKPSYGTELIKK